VRWSVLRMICRSRALPMVPQVLSCRPAPDKKAVERAARSRQRERARTANTRRGQEETAARRDWENGGKPNPESDQTQTASLIWSQSLSIVTRKSDAPSGSPSATRLAATVTNVIAIFRREFPPRLRRGYYVVYLFHVSEPIVHLSQNQGTMAVREEFGAIARQVLLEGAAFIRQRLPDFVLRLPATLIARGMELYLKLNADQVKPYTMGRLSGSGQECKCRSVG
jgi:hypothetical protein